MGYDTKHCVTTHIRSSRTIEDEKTGFWSFEGAFFLVLVVSVVMIASFRSFRFGVSGFSTCRFRLLLIIILVLKAVFIVKPNPF